MAKSIEWGGSVLNQANDASDAINQNLHEHFNVARRANMKLTPKEERINPGREGRGETYHPDTNAFHHIQHDPHTGEVASASTAANAYGWGGPQTSDPKEARANLNQAKNTSRKFQERESGGREAYRAELRAEKAGDAEDARPATEVAKREYKPSIREEEKSGKRPDLSPTSKLSPAEYEKAFRQSEDD